ncbi:ALCAM [Mytilus coruscus]|uniref:ALCAM n=1 Tax=Mytilus coruscus TaxID=42192 RepID=A0A6J8DI06_MYTCO|nr:ALCAM [Mytilus coruscus]
MSHNLSENVTGLLGGNGTELECAYTDENIVRVFVVSFMALNRTNIIFETIATYIPDKIPRYITTTYSVEQTTTAQGIAEGDNITVVCTGDVGKPPAEHIFQKYLGGHILSMTYSATKTSVLEISENCSYYRTSNLTFQVTAKDNNAVIRCVVNSSMAQSDMLYVETAPIEVYYNEAQSTTFRNTVSSLSKVENTAVIVVGTVCGSIILVLGIVFGVIKNKTFRCLLMRNRNDRSADYVNTTQQQNPSLYEEVGHTLDVHNYEQLSRIEHLYNNANFSRT